MSRDPILDPDEDLLIKSIYNRDSLEADEVIEFNESISINDLPGNLFEDDGGGYGGGYGSGGGSSIDLGEDDLNADWHLIFQTDTFNYVSEADEADNVTAIPIELLAPDLTISDAQVPINASVNDIISVSWTVDNIGDVSAFNEGYDALYLSNDESFDSEDDIYIDNFDISDETLESTSDSSNTSIFPLSASDGYSLTKEITLPNTSIGSKHLIFVADAYNDQIETDGVNNIYVAPIEISATDVNLSVTGSTASTAASLGESIDVEWTVTNDGSSSANANRSDGIYISDNPIFDSNDDYITSINSEDNALLAGGDSFTTQKNITIPNSISGGNRYLLFVGDYNNEQYESNETDNVYAVPLTINAPNLKITEVTGLDSEVLYVGGGRISVGWTVNNDSNLDANSSYWYDYVYLSEDETYDEDEDSLLRSRFIGSSKTPEAGESYTTSRSFNLPDVRGDYYLLFYTDANGRQGESNELDNTYSVPISITELDVDFTIDNFTVPNFVNEGDEVKIPVEWTIRNSGTTPTTAISLYDRIYLSNDDELDTNTDIRLTSSYKDISDPPILPDKSYTQKRNVYANNLEVGNYFLILKNDYWDAQEESNEDNNTLAVPFEVVGKPNLTVVDSEVPNKLVVNSTIPISWTVKNLGDETAYSPGWTDSIYLSDDQFFDDDEDEYLDEVEQDNQATTEKSKIYTSKLDLTIPNTALGDRHLLFVTRAKKSGGDFVATNFLRAIVTNNQSSQKS